MASRPNSIVENPNWNSAQRKYFKVIQEALPIAMGYLEDEIPILDNHTDGQLIDETGALKAAKKFIEKPEKAHVERLKARIGDLETGVAKNGSAYTASFRGGGRIILNQEACKEVIAAFDEEGIHLKRLLAAIQSGQVVIPDNCLLNDPVDENEPAETNRSDFFTSAAGGRSLYVEAI